MRNRAVAVVVLALASALAGGAAPLQDTPVFAALVEDNEGGYRAFAVGDRAVAEQATATALNQCGRASCELVLTFQGRGCGAFTSAGPDAAFGWAVKPTLAEAREVSVAECKAQVHSIDEVCSNQVTVCNTLGTGEPTTLYSLDEDTESDEDDWGW